MSDLAFCNGESTPFWQTPITGLNRMPARSPLHGYRSLADAATGEPCAGNVAGW